MSDLPADVKNEWARFALVDGMSDFVWACHIHGHSYLHRCFVVLREDQSVPYVAFLNEPAGACMVAMDRLLIAPLDQAVVLPNGRFKRWLVKKLAMKMPVL
jgi:hypothetical protein